MAAQRPASKTRTLTVSLLVIIVIALMIVIAVVGAWRAGVRHFQGSPAETCTVVGVDSSGNSVNNTMPLESAENAALISAVSMERNMLAHAATVALATASVETNYRNLDYGDRDSLGLFQQRPSQGWGTPSEVQNPIYASNVFYAHLAAIENYQDLPVGVVAQRVQLSGYPDRYAQHEPVASTWAAAFTGQQQASVSCVLPQQAAALAREKTLAQEMAEEFGAETFASLEEVDGVLTVQAASHYSGAGSLNQQEAMNAVHAAVANWAVTHMSGQSIKSIEYNGKVFRSEKNTDSFWGTPAGWENADGAPTDSVRITFST